MNLVPKGRLVKEFLNSLEKLEFGEIEITTPKGTTKTFKCPQPGPQAKMVVRDWDFLSQAAARGDIGLGESYIEGLWETDSIEELFSFFLINLDALEESYAHGSWLSRAVFNIQNKILNRNSKTGSRENIRAHYDVGNDFYQLWLDETMTYSSAIYENGDEDLAKAQRQKYGRILNKTYDNAANGKTLEIGCGWGGFAESAVEEGRDVSAITISNAQYEFAKNRLGNKADIRLQDYRDLNEKFNAIVSIEMFEAVGEKYWSSYFSTIKNSLAEGGKAVIQTITIADGLFAGYRKRSDFIRHYTFPGGMLPSVAKFKSESAKAGLTSNHVFSFGLDYMKTIQEWTTRFEAKEKEIIKLGYTEKFIRNWKFYLGICAAAFRVGRTDVVQVELSHA